MSFGGAEWIVGPVASLITTHIDSVRDAVEAGNPAVQESICEPYGISVTRVMPDKMLKAIPMFWLSSFAA